MSRKPKTVEPAMELVIQHHVGPDPGAPGLPPLEARLEGLPAAFAAALREEMAKGTLVVTLAPGTGGLKIRPAKPRSRRPAPAEAADSPA